MKIGTPELKTKPATKYFDGGYVRFYTVYRELFFVIHGVDKLRMFSINEGRVKDTEHLTQLLSIKTISEAVNQ